VGSTAGKEKAWVLPAQWLNLWKDPEVTFWDHLGYKRAFPLIQYLGIRVCNRGKARKMNTCFQTPGDVRITGHPCMPAELRKNKNMGNPPTPREEI